MAQERGVKRSESEERKEPYNILNRSEQHRTTTEWKMVTETNREEQKPSHANEPYESAKKKKKKSLRTDSLEEQYLSKVPKRSPRNRKQSYSVLNWTKPPRRIAA